MTPGDPTTHGMQALVLVALVPLLLAALHDLVARTIPDALSALTAVGGLALRAVDGTLGPAVLVAALVLATATMCCARGWVGGGDVKLLAAAMLLLPPPVVPVALEAVGLVGALLALPYLAARGRLRRPPAGQRALPLRIRAWRAERFRLARGGPVPYGAAIAAGLVITVLGGPS